MNWNIGIQMARRAETVACIVFDFDGVLVDSNAVKRKAYYEALADIPGSSEVIAELLGGPTVEPVDRYHTMGRIVSLLRARALLPGEDWPKIIAERTDRYTRICARDLPRCDEVPGASQVLAILSQTHPLYVNSATPEPILRTAVAKRGWAAYFREVLGSPATKTANLRRAALAEGIEPRRILFVGDSEVDRRAAEQCRCAFVGLVIEKGRFDVPVQQVVTDLSQLSSLL